VISIWLRDFVFAVQGWPPLGALALGFSFSNYLEVGVLLWLLKRKLHYLHGAQFLSGAWRMLLATVLMAGATWLLLSTIDDDAVWLQLILGVFAGGAVYVLACLLLRVREPSQILTLGRERLLRSR
jgi:peptidoglycan biosynthesis protein MviN/MurJ (putative lipid II flippase)